MFIYYYFFTDQRLFSKQLEFCWMKCKIRGSMHSITSLFFLIKYMKDPLSLTLFLFVWSIFLLKNKDLGVILMSATADIRRYKDYFRDLGRGERVEVLEIPSSNQKDIFQWWVPYLEQVTAFLGSSPKLITSRYCSGPCPSMTNAEIKLEVHGFIYELVLHIYENELDIEKDILRVFTRIYSRNWANMVKLRVWTYVTTWLTIW